MRFQCFAYILLLCLLSCCQAKKEQANYKTKVDSSAINTRSGTSPKKIRNIPAPVFAQAHPNAKLLLRDSFYFSSNDEAGPFGNTDGISCYARFNDWRQTHKNNDPKVFLSEELNDMAYPKFDLDETDIVKLTPYLQQHEFGSRLMSGTDAAIVAIAFGQLYLEGTIDSNIKEIAKTSVRRQLIPELLAEWGDPFQLERKAKLMKMLAVLNK